MHDTLKKKPNQIHSSSATSTNQWTENIKLKRLDDANVCQKLGTNDQNTTIFQPSTFNLCRKIGAKIQGDDLSHLNTTEFRQKLARMISRSQGIWNNDSINAMTSWTPCRINVIIGGSSPCKDYVWYVKEFQKLTRAKLGPAKPENDVHLTFSEEDVVDVAAPHNDPLLAELTIGNNKVTKSSST